MNGSVTDSTGPSGGVLETATAVLTDPKGFFEKLPREGGYEAPGVFAAIMALVYCGVVAVLSIVGLHPTGFFFALLVLPILVAIGFGIGTAIVFFVSKALGGDATFESSFRITAYTSAISPISAALAVIPYASILASAYGLYLAIVAIVAVNRVPEAKAWKILGGIGAALLAISLASEMAARRAADRLEGSIAELEIKGKDIEKAAQDWIKELEKVQGEQPPE